MPRLLSKSVMVRSADRASPIYTSNENSRRTRCLLRKTYKFCHTPSFFQQCYESSDAWLVPHIYMRRGISSFSPVIHQCHLINTLHLRPGKATFRSLLQTESPSCLPGGRTTMTASPSIVLASRFPQASRSAPSETMLQLPRRWRGPGSMKIRLREGTQLQPSSLHTSPTPY